MSFNAVAWYDPDLIDEMECPLCSHLMRPPIRQCTTGHSFCNKCFRRMKRCPECRVSLAITVRNISMENFYSKMLFPCRNSLAGCKEVDLADKIMEHEAVCRIVATYCPICFSWAGTTEDLLTHCQEKHVEALFYNENQRMVCPKFRKKTQNVYHHFFVFNVHERLFLFVWDVNFSTGIMRWCVFLIKDDDDCVDFNFQIEINKYHDQVKRLCMGGPCPVLGHDRGLRVINNQQFVLSHRKMLGKYCRRNDLIYRVKIFKRGDSP